LSYGPKRRDDQIIALLNKLGDRMIRGEQNRQALENRAAQYDSLFSALEDRAANSEKIFLTLQRKISDAEDIEQRLRDRQDKLEREQKAQSEKLERVASLALKMEEALAQQARLARRLEKITHDRARMLRKLESIEETVLQTRESLNAKALVLLTEQSAAASSGAPQLPADPENLADLRRRRTGGWGGSAFPVRAVSAAAVVLLLLIGGWAGMNVYKDYAGRFAGQETKTDMAAAPDFALPERAQITADADDAITGEDVFQADDTELLARMDEDPAALAAALNEIEPASAPAEEKVEEAPSAAAGSPEKAQAKKQEKDRPAAAVEKFDVEGFIKEQKQSRALADRIKPDEKLPSVIKEIEKKAFEGVPEAQHDLAAIYTAGHGGVPVDYKKAIAWFTEAAIGGVANARYNLGVLYHQGMGAEKNLEKAINWYRAAAVMDHPEAQYNLGIAYIEGIGAPYNPQLAAEYFRKAARGGIGEAAYNLGLVLENGLLGTPAPREALYWYKKAADNGSPEGKMAMTQLAKAMDIKITEIDGIIDDLEREVPDVSVPPQQKTGKQSNNVIESFPSISSEDTELSPAPAVPDKMAATSPNSSGHVTVAQIQEQLMRLGLYPGPADGVSGPVTEDAIRAYQARNGLEATGKPTDALLVHLLASEIDASSADMGSRE